MKKCLLVGFVLSWLFLGCKTVSKYGDNMSQLNDINLKHPDALAKKIEARQKKYPGLAVAGYAVQIYGFKDFNSAPTKDNTFFCNYPGSIKVSKDYEALTGFSEKIIDEKLKGKVVGNVVSAYKDVSCPALISSGSGDEIQKDVSWKLQKASGSLGDNEDRGNFTVIQYHDTSSALKALDEIPSSEVGTGRITDIKNMISIVYKGYTLFYSGEEGTVDIYKYDKNRNSSLLSVKVPAGYKSYCATIQYYCTTDSQKTPVLCLGSSRDKGITTDRVCGEAQNGTVTLKTPLEWSRSFYDPDDNGSITTGTEDVNVELQPSIQD